MSVLRRLYLRVVPEKYRPSSYIRELVFKRTNGQVVAGPFSGLKYLPQSWKSALMPKLLGTYEQCLQPELEGLIASRPDLIVDVGAAEGYYAVGLALRCPDARVIAFDSAEKARHLLREIARINGVEDRIDIRGSCGPVELAQALRGGARRVLVCDCEGHEEVLLDPLALPEMRDTAILAEMHEFISRGITGRIRARFESTHVVQEIWEEECRAKFPYPTLRTRLLPRRFTRRPFDEERPERMNWLWMKPRLPIVKICPTVNGALS
jgi:hypothetical protein